jgi:hypothetical protein
MYDHLRVHIAALLYMSIFDIQTTWFLHVQSSLVCMLNTFAVLNKACLTKDQGCNYCGTSTLPVKAKKMHNVEFSARAIGQIEFELSMLALSPVHCLDYLSFWQVPYALGLPRISRYHDLSVLLSALDTMRQDVNAQNYLCE